MTPAYYTTFRRRMSLPLSSIRFAVSIMLSRMPLDSTSQMPASWSMPSKSALPDGTLVVQRPMGVAGDYA